MSNFREINSLAYQTLPIILANLVKKAHYLHSPSTILEVRRGLANKEATIMYLGLNLLCYCRFKNLISNKINNNSIYSSLNK